MQGSQASKQLKKPKTEKMEIIKENNYKNLEQVGGGGEAMSWMAEYSGNCPHAKQIKIQKKSMQIPA